MSSTLQKILNFAQKYHKNGFDRVLDKVGILLRIYFFQYFCLPNTYESVIYGYVYYIISNIIEFIIFYTSTYIHSYNILNK